MCDYTCLLPPVHGDVDEVEDGNVGEEEIEIRPPGAEEGAGYQPAHVQSVTNIDMTYNDWKQIKHVYCLTMYFSFLDILMAVTGMEMAATSVSAAASDTTCTLLLVWSRAVRA